jgi:hypothetical protein
MILPLLEAVQSVPTELTTPTTVGLLYALFRYLDHRKGKRRDAAYSIILRELKLIRRRVRVLSRDVTVIKAKQAALDELRKPVQ